MNELLEKINNGSIKLSEATLKLLGKIGEGINTVITAGGATDFGLTSPFVQMDRQAIHNSRMKTIDKAKEKIAEASSAISPSSHVVAWANGTMNPWKGTEIISQADPRLLVLAIGADMVTLAKGPKVVKTAAKTTGNAAVDVAARAGNKTAKAKAVSRRLEENIEKAKLELKTSKSPVLYNVSDNITLYRANANKPKASSRKAALDNYAELYIGQWFTDDPRKPFWYAANYARHGELPMIYLTTVPRYWAELLRASRKISDTRVELEPEDFILEDGVKGLQQGVEPVGRPGTLQYLTLSLPTPKLIEPSTAYFGNPTLNFLKFVGNPKLGRESAANSIFYGPEKNLVKELRKSGVDLTKIPKNAISLALLKRKLLIQETSPESYTLVETNPLLYFNYLLSDIRKGNVVGWMNADFKNNNLYIRGVEKTNPSYNGVYEKLLNSSILSSKTLGGEGTISGLLLISAPKQYSVIQKFRDRQKISNNGNHTNARQFLDKTGIEGEDGPAFNMLDLKRAGDSLVKTLLSAPVWKLKSPIKSIPIKSDFFNPYIIDYNGLMHINWNDIMTHKYGGKME